MTTLEDVLKSVGKKQREIFKKALSSKGIDDFSKEIKDGWLEVYTKLGLGSSPISYERQLEMLEAYPVWSLLWQQENAAIEQEVRGEWEAMTLQEKRDWIAKPVWQSVSPTEEGYRLAFGIATEGCDYRRLDLPCTFCGLSIGSLMYRDTTGIDNVPKLQLQAIDAALSYYHDGLKAGKFPKIKRVEMLNDGSSSNPKELPHAVVLESLRKFAELDEVETVVIESRPEYLLPEYIEQYMDVIRPDQTLEIAMGLESEDPFLLFLSNKGYTTKEFEEALDVIAELREDLPKKRKNGNLGAFAYSIVKPAGIKEGEAVDLGVSMGRYVAEVREKHPFLSLKYEPCVISRGTMSYALYKLIDKGTGKEFHTPPSYWSVLEMFARVADEGITDGTRLGLREDMDVFSVTPAIYDEKKNMHKSDFVVYDSLQKFIQDKDVVKLLAQVSLLLENGDAEESMNAWMKEAGLTEPTFVRLYEEQREVVEAYKRDNEHFKRKAELLKGIYDNVIDEVQYGDAMVGLVDKIHVEGLKGHEDEVATTIEDIFRQNLDEGIVGNMSEMAVEYTKLLRKDIGEERLQTRIQFNYDDELYTVWVSVPKENGLHQDNN